MSALYEAHESFWSAIKMYFQMFKKAILGGLAVQFIVMLIILFQVPKLTFTDAEGSIVTMPWWVHIKYHTTWYTGFFLDEFDIEKSLVPYANGWTRLPISQYKEFVDLLTDGAYFERAAYIKKCFILSFLSYLFSVLYLLVFGIKSKKMSDAKFIRGAQFTPIKEFIKKLNSTAKKNKLSVIEIGGAKIPFEMESKHFLLLGTTGSGKGVTINLMAANVINRKYEYKTSDRMIFYDPKGEFVAKLYQPGDLVFSPFDARTLRWNIFNEIENLIDVEIISQALFQPPKGGADNSEYWYIAAGEVFKAGLTWLKLNNKTSTTELWNFFAQHHDDIKKALRTLPPGKRNVLQHIDGDNASAASSIISIVQSRIKFFEHLTDVDGDFSFRRYIRGEAKKNRFGLLPNMFILNNELFKDTFNPLLSLAIDLMCREMLSLPDDHNRRVFLVLDELGTLNKMESVLTLEAVGRSKGACLICASQDLGRIEEKYGRANLRSFYNNFNTTITFRMKDPETMDFLSKAIGEQQVIKTAQSRQMSANEVGDRKSLSEQDRTERLILPSEFQFLEDRHAIINITGFGVSQVVIPADYLDDRHPQCVMRKFPGFEELIAEIQQDKKTTEQTNEIEKPQVQHSQSKPKSLEL